MKYIRALDDIWEYNQKDNIAIRPSRLLDKSEQMWLRVKKDYIEKQADTIKELCDEFVMLRLKDELNDNEPIIFKHLDLAKSYFEKYLGYAIYGAIWTDKGLIYVAKMNKKGELKLL